MNCKQCNKASKKQIDCKGCTYNFCSISCMMAQSFSNHDSSSITPTSTITHQLKTAKATFLKIKSRITNPSSFTRLQLGTMLNNSFTPLSHEDFITFQIKQNILGSGSYSNVYLSFNTMDQKEYAIKLMNKKRIKEKIGTFDIINKEIEIHLRLYHPNIVRLHSYYEDSTSFYLIMDYCQQGNLFQLLKKKKLFEETEALNYFIQAALAVYFLHENNLIHRDIKPENLLLDDSNILKLCDFGLCNNNSIGNRNTLCGTLEYMAPEILNENSYDKSVDIWSLGVLLFELTNGQTPFKQHLSNQTQKVNYINQNISVPCKELIKKMLCYDPKQRITVKEIFNEPIIANMVVKIIKKVNINASYTINKTSIIGKKERDINKEQDKEKNGSCIEDYINAQTEPNKMYKKKNARSNSSFDENIFKFHQPSQIGMIAKDMMIVNNNNLNNSNNDSNSTYFETTIRKNEKYLSSKNNNNSFKEKLLMCCSKVKDVMKIDHQDEKDNKIKISVTCHLLDAINLVERAKIIKKQIEIPFNKY